MVLRRNFDFRAEARSKQQRRLEVHLRSAQVNPAQKVLLSRRRRRPTRPFWRRHRRDGCKSYYRQWPSGRDHPPSRNCSITQKKRRKEEALAPNRARERWNKNTSSENSLTAPSWAPAVISEKIRLTNGVYFWVTFGSSPFSFAIVCAAGHRTTNMSSFWAGFLGRMLQRGFIITANVPWTLLVGFWVVIVTVTWSIRLVTHFRRTILVENQFAKSDILVNFL